MIKNTVVNQTVLAVVVAAISALFLSIVWRFLEAIFLAALFAAVFHPLYRRMLGILGERRGIAALSTLLIVLCFIFTPVFLIATVVIGQGACLLYTSPSPRDGLLSRMPSSA